MAVDRPKEVGLTHWFALGALGLAVVTFVLDLPALGAVLVLLTLLWGITALYRVLRIHRHVTAVRE